MSQLADLYMILKNNINKNHLDVMNTVEIVMKAMELMEEEKGISASQKKTKVIQLVQLILEEFVKPYVEPVVFEIVNNPEYIGNAVETVILVSKGATKINKKLKKKLACC
jgi:uncharacterized protein YajQ (UPF0234 family)